MQRLFTVLLLITLSLPIPQAGGVAHAQTQAKTRIVDRIVDASGNPRMGKVTFILTEKALAGLVGVSRTNNKAQVYRSSSGTLEGPNITDTGSVVSGTDGLIDLQTRLQTRLRIADDGEVTIFGSLGGSDLQTVITAFGASQGTLRIETAQTVSADLTIPANVTVTFGGTGQITVADTKTLTISGAFQAPQRQVFANVSAGHGSVVFGAGAVDTVYAKWFGNCVTELGTPLNAAISSIKNAGGTIQLPSGSLTQTVSINATNLDGGLTLTKFIKIEGHGRGTNINCQLKGVCFDATGSQFLDLRDFVLSGQGTTAPTVGFLFARNSTHNSAGRNHLENVETMGTFSIAALYNYASEEFRVTNSYFQNSDTLIVNGKPVVVVTNDNHLSVTSPYAAIDRGPQSTTEIRFTGCAFNSYAATGNADSLYLRGASSVTVENSFLYNKTRSYVHIDAGRNASNMVFHHLMFDGAATANYGFYITGSSEQTRLTIDDILDYGVKAPGAGGYSLYAADGTTLSGLSIRQLYDTSGTAIRGDVILYSDIDATAGGTVNIHQYIQYSELKVASNKLTVARMDLSTSTKFFYLDLGILASNRRTGKSTPVGAVVPLFLGGRVPGYHSLEVVQVDRPDQHELGCAKLALSPTIRKVRAEANCTHFSF